MELKAREDIDAPIDFVFDQVTDFAAFERLVMRRGGDVEQLKPGGVDGIGATWRITFKLRGVERDVQSQVTKADRPNLLELEVTSKNADAIMRLELVEMSRSRTRMSVQFDAVAKSIPAKLLFQSLRFARQKTKARFTGAVSSFAKDVETRYRS